MAKSTKTNKNLEAQFDELSAIIKLLESGDLPLEGALEQFESGITLIKNCQGILEQAEQKIKALTADFAHTDLADPES